MSSSGSRQDGRVTFMRYVELWFWTGWPRYFYHGVVSAHNGNILPYFCNITRLFNQYFFYVTRILL